MKSQVFKLALGALLLCVAASGTIAFAQTQGGGKTPLTNEEFLSIVRQLPKRPGLREQLINEVRERGINFPLTPGLRSFVATKSGNDPDLRRTLEEAERRMTNPAAAALPPAEEGNALLERTRAATLAASEKMPDFVVKQLISRYYARGNTRNWTLSDRLTLAVSYRASSGEQFKLLALNGLPLSADAVQEKSDYSEAGGSSSTGDYVGLLASIFAAETKAEFKLVDTDTLRGRRALVYEYTVKQPDSRYTITFSNSGRSIVTGYRGRIWVDRESNRVLRFELTATDIPADFPITANSRTIDYDWVSIGSGIYLLPARSVVESTARMSDQVVQSRNVIRFSGYQRYGTEVKVIEDDFVEDDAPDKKP